MKKKRTERLENSFEENKIKSLIVRNDEKKGEENRKQEKLNPEMYEEEKKVLH